MQMQSQDIPSGTHIQSKIVNPELLLYRNSGASAAGVPCCLCKTLPGTLSLIVKCLQMHQNRISLEIQDRFWPEQFKWPRNIGLVSQFVSHSFCLPLQGGKADLDLSSQDRWVKELQNDEHSTKSSFFSNPGCPFRPCLSQLSFGSRHGVGFKRICVS